MKRLKSELPGARRFKLLHILFVIAAFYLIFLSFKFPHILEIASVLSSDDTYVGVGGVSVGDSEGRDLSRPFFGTVYKGAFYRRLVDNGNQNPPLMPLKEPLEQGKGESWPTKPIQHGYGRITGETMRQRNKTIDLSLLERMADEAWTLGLKAWEEVDKFHEEDVLPNFMIEGKPTSCPSWASMNGKELASRDRIMFLPCGIAVGSSITVVGTPRYAHQEYIPQLAKLKKGDPTVLISQFMVDLQGGLKSVTGEDPPKILHVNPRLKGDWSHRPVIEHNTFRGRQWGTAQRCNGLPLEDDDDMLVDGHVRCEQWMMNDFVDSKESKSWFGRFIGHPQKPEVTWPFPFVEGRLFVLTLRAGFEGYHIIVGGQHMTSFPYRPGFRLEDATGLAIKGDVDVHSVYATSLPTSHPSFLPHRILEMSAKWKAHPLPKSHIQLFIGVLSTTNHFAERMAIRKTWMQSPEIKSSNVVVRFFVALNQKKEVNAVLKKEAAYFGDIVILPFMDHYDIVVLKTIAICEFGVQNVSAAYVMKCDDDTFVRVDTVLKEIKGVSNKRSLYMGNLNLLHRPLRRGKWAVTYKEWPDEAYPPYANGPGYIISSNIAKFVASERANKRLRLFKMEDVSMGMWVEEFNITMPVQYSHNWRFCQYGCMEDYYTAHYQSPRQMICLWEHLSRGRAQCCNFR